MNLALQILSTLPLVLRLEGMPLVLRLEGMPLVLKLEGMLWITYTYFSSSPKRHLEQCALTKLLETKGLNFFT